MYKERNLSPEEYWAAMALRAVPAEKRLAAAQAFCHAVEDLRERAHRALDNCETGSDKYQRKAVWEALQFPRYRFFDVALPNGDWEKFAENRCGSCDGTEQHGLGCPEDNEQRGYGPLEPPYQPVDH